MAAKKRAKNNEPKFDAFGPAKAVVNNARAVANMITSSSGPSMKAGKNPPARKPASSMMAAAPKPYVAPFKKEEAPRPAPKRRYVAPYKSETPPGPRSGGKPLNTTPVPKPKKNKPKGGGKNVPVWKF